MAWRIAAVLLAVPLASCMTIRRGGSPLLPIASTPPGAAIVIDGLERGTTPASLPVSGSDNHMLVLRMACHADEVVMLKRDFGLMPWLWGNMLVPVVGHVVDVATGAAWLPYPQRVDAKLAPVPCQPK